MKKIKKILLSRTFLFIILALLQIAFFVGLLVYFSSLAVSVYSVLTILSVLVIVLVMENDDANPAYRMMWMLIVVLLPVAGAAFYLLWGNRNVGRRMGKVLARIEQDGNDALEQDAETLRSFCRSKPAFAPMAKYLSQQSNPLYTHTACEYYPMGEDFFSRFLEELEQAQRFIFLEYFIIDEGEMWSRTLEILERKARQGVDVRVCYDFIGSMFNLSRDYPLTLREKGIKCYAFNPIRFSFHLSEYTLQNHRNHRKIAVIDGKVGFMGGLNLADEYINKRSRFGVWKDTSFMLRGDGVYSLTVTFLKTWDFAAHEVTDPRHFRVSCPQESDCYVQPYADTPIDGESVAENAYLHVINNARKYVYITTPYLVIDHEMMTALTLAAKSGVDVRIVTPGIPDKKNVYLVTQSYYRILLAAGVRIYEFTPGFLHAKMYVCDDKTAIVGSANMDYRSLYLHFENCCAFYGGKIVRAVRRDMTDIFAQSREVTLEEVKRTKLPKRLMQSLLRFFAPML